MAKKAKSTAEVAAETESAPSPIEPVVVANTAAVEPEPVAQLTGLTDREKTIRDHAKNGQINVFGKEIGEWLDELETLRGKAGGGK